MASLVPCAVPGCGRRVDRRSASGVCQTHNHHRDFCACHRCVQRRGVPVTPAKAPDPDRVTVQVAVHRTTSGADTKAAVTLQRAPWERTAHG